MICDIHIANNVYIPWDNIWVPVIFFKFAYEFSAMNKVPHSSFTPTPISLSLSCLMPLHITF